MAGITLLKGQHMNAVIDPADLATQQRHHALQDAVTSLRRAASACQAAAAGSDDPLRIGVLSDSTRRLSLVLRELQALA